MSVRGGKPFTCKDSPREKRELNCELTRDVSYGHLGRSIR